MVCLKLRNGQLGTDLEPVVWTERPW